MRIAVAGNPNSGKTTLFNRLTGARAHVGNYPGVTVERREGQTRLPSGKPGVLVDLPGCYSLTARSAEEEVAHQVLMGAMGGAPPDAIVCVVDATSLARGLYLAVQLCELELPVVVALNMIDLAEAQGLRLDVAALSQRLGCPVVATSGRLGTGLQELLAAVESAKAATALDYGLQAADRQGIDEVRRELSATGAQASFGHTLWLLTSEAEPLRHAVTPDFLARVTEARRRLDAGEERSFNRRIIAARYQTLDRLLEGVVDAGAQKPHRPTERLDRVLMHPVWGLVVFIAAMFVLFQAVFAWAQPMIDGIEGMMGLLADAAAGAIPLGLTRSLVVNGLIAGVGNILVFLPQIALLFFGLTLLEESGYLARAAFLLDRLMRKVGLHGKAFIPLMSGFACAVPAVMSARTVESRRDRLVTILVTPFMSCSARLPVYILVTAAVFSTSPDVFGFLSVGGLATFAMYVLGFVAAIATAFLLKRSVLRAPSPAFILELPTYKLPLAREVVRRVYERCKVFVTETGAVILALSLVLWALLSFPSQDPSEAELSARQARLQTMGAEQREAALVELERHDAATRLEGSFAGQLGHAIEPLIAPLGFDWRIGIGLIASFAAREVLVSTLGQVYAIGADVEPDSPALRDSLLADKDPQTGAPRFSPLAGLSLMVFFVLAMQCLSTVAAVKRETNSWRWPLAQLVYMNGLAYVASLRVFQTGKALGFG